MLGNLRARLILSFAVVVAGAVLLAGTAALFLLRDQQEENARERYGRHAEPVNERVATMLAQGRQIDDVYAMLDARADELDARVLLLDDDLLVVFDSEDDALRGKHLLAFENRNLPLADDEGSRYRWTNYSAAGEKLTLFEAPPSDSETQFASTTYQAIVAVPASQLSQAWLELAPRLALAGAIALAVAFLVAFFISRSISGPLARITQASVQMAQGDYDVHIPITGEDEVGRLSEAFNAMARQVNGSQRMMKDLLANVSHELKTPLTSIQGFSQAMLDGAIQSPEEFRESGRIINEEASRMRALVDDLLLLSQIESGQAELEHKHIDLAGLLDRMMERFQWALRDANIGSGLHVDRLPEVHGDERRLEQVFGNLMENAVRHTPPGGRITINAVPANGKASVSIHNTGSYIPQEDLPRVFERFFQVDRARARRSGTRAGSSGLGLSIVREIVEAHGGSVVAKSAEDSGTEFIVTLPAAATTTATRTQRSASQEAARQRREAPAS